MAKVWSLKKLSAQHTRLLIISAVLAVITALIVFILSFHGQYLLLCNANTEEVLLCVQAAEGEKFSVSFTHSVNKSPVCEYYQIRNSKIYLISLSYETFGAGMPTHPEEGQIMRFEDNAMVITGFEREMPYLCYFVGRFAGHSLSWRDNSIALDSLDKPGQPISFSVIKYPRFFILLNIYPDSADSWY